MEASFVVPALAPRPRSAWSLLGDGLRRRGALRALSFLAIVLVLAGGALITYPLITDIWQRHIQDGLRGQLGSSQLKTDYLHHTIPVGDALTRLQIPRIGLDVVVVEGTTPSALRAGAGHYVGTPLPGDVGNVGIAGHRTTFGHPFNRLDEVQPGDQIILTTPFDTDTYVAVRSFDGQADPHPVDPNDTSVLLPHGQDRLLTLTTCHPKGSAAQRLILRAVLVSDFNHDRKTTTKYVMGSADTDT